jgi:hypothetical protein
VQRLYSEQPPGLTPIVSPLAHGPDAPAWDGQATPRLMSSVATAPDPLDHPEPIRTYAWSDGEKHVKCVPRGGGGVVGGHAEGGEGGREGGRL